MEIDLLRDITVRIKDKDKDLIGTGMLWIDGKDKKTIFIFTAGHVLFGKKEFYIDIYLKEISGEYKIEESDVVFHENFKEKNGKVYYDVAIIKYCFKENINIKFHEIYIAKSIAGVCVESWGFSKKTNEDDLNNSGMHLTGKMLTSSDEDTENLRFEIETPTIDVTDRDNELKGISGAPLVVYNDEYIEFLGVISNGKNNAAANIIGAFSSTLFEETIKKFGDYNIERSNGVLDSFKCVRDDAINSFENENVKKYILASIDNIIEKKKTTPKKLIDFYDDCYDIKRCSAPNKYMCKKRWENKLFFISLLNFMDIDEKNFQKPILELGTNAKVNVEFLCSQGSTYGTKMKTLIENIDDAICNNRCDFEDDSIIIWSSKERPNREYIGRNDYDSIIHNIYKQPKNHFKYKEKSIDIKTGKESVKKFSILHIYKLRAEIDSLNDDCGMEDIISKVKEVLDNVNSGKKL